MLAQFRRENIEPAWQDLVNDFPEIFLEPSPHLIEIYNQAVERGNDSLKLEDMCNLRFSFECGIGWKNIIREFCYKIRELVNTAKQNGHEIHFKTFILKEKFGIMRNQGVLYGKDRDLYVSDFYRLNAELEDASAVTCEKTGESGEMTISKSGWRRTLCAEEAYLISKDK